MGDTLSRNLHKVVTANDDAWNKLGRGPQLRQLFGAYRSTDCWAVKRKFAAIDDGDGYVSYDEMQQLCHLPVFNLLFIWDNFSHQNELVDARELLTVICIFSSARLDEKGRFLMSLFDASQCGRNTGAEVARLCTVVLAMLGRCTGVVVKPKNIIEPLRSEFCDLVPEFRDAQLEVGFERAWKSERVVGPEQLDRILPTIRGAYEALPTYGQPPRNAANPPPPDWAAAPAKEDPKKLDTGEIRKVPKKPKKESELAHLTWLDRFEDTLTQTNDVVAETDNEPAHGWLVMNGKEFQAIARDVVSFQNLFVKHTAKALSLPSDCVEVLNITSGSIIVEFKLHSPDHGRDPRPPFLLMQLFNEQLQTPYSALRRSPLGEFTDSTDLLNSEPKRLDKPRIPKPDPVDAEGAQMWADQGTQADFADFGTPRLGKQSSTSRENAADADTMRKIREAVRELDLVRQKTAKVEKSNQALSTQLQERDRTIADLRAVLGMEGKSEPADKSQPKDTITFEIDGVVRVAEIVGNKKADVVSLMTHRLRYVSGAEGEEWVRLDEKRNVLTDEQGHCNVSYQRNSV